MKTVILAVITILMVSIIGCAHAPSSQFSCSIAAQHSPTEFDICLGSRDVKVGDRVAFFKKKCTPPSRGHSKKCRNEQIGEGLITNTLDEHLSTVKLDTDFIVSESTIVEKIVNGTEKE